MRTKNMVLRLEPGAGRTAGGGGRGRRPLGVRRGARGDHHAGRQRGSGTRSSSSCWRTTSPGTSASCRCCGTSSDDPLDWATLVVIAGKALGLDTPAVLDLLDLSAPRRPRWPKPTPAADSGDPARARGRAAQPRSSGTAPGPRQRPGRGAGDRHVPRGERLAGRSRPGRGTAAMVCRAGRRATFRRRPAAWLSPRISAYREPATPLSPAKEAPMHGWLPGLRRKPPAQGGPCSAGSARGPARS